MIHAMGAVLFCLGSFCAQAAHTQARLVLAVEAARPGDTVLAGVRLEMDRGWHSYWKNPGDSGAATKIEWQLPAGVSVGETQWPVPEKLIEAELTTYIYTQEAVLLVPLRLAPDLRAGPLELKAKVSWLECATLCVPGSATVQATLEVGRETRASPEAGLIEAWQKRVPQKAGGIAFKAWWEIPAAGNVRPLVLEWSAPNSVGNADFFPDSSEAFEVQTASERMSASTGIIRLRKQVKKFSGDWPREISGVAIEQSGEERLAYAVKALIAAPGGAVAVPPAADRMSNGLGSVKPSLLAMLFYAFIGGLILNVMPCVLPVIALKIVGFVSEASSEPKRVRRLGLIYALGVLVSFGALAGLVIGVKAAGHQAGWGMQFSSPQFLVVLTVLVTLVALNLFGLFEVTLSGRVMGAAGTLAARQGAAGAFFNGVLATILATPCTAPFLSIALGFAFAQTGPVIVLAFLSIGLGLAFPYVVLSWHPAWLKFLPKPGAWMERFKIAMGFPMLATAFWLFSLIPIYYGDRSWWLGVFLVIVALAAWVYGEFVQRGRSRRGVGFAISLLLLVGGYVGVAEGRLHWLSPGVLAPGGAVGKEAGGVAWQAWSREAVAAARAQGRPVLVDFTAKWCVTCNAIVKPALEAAAIRQKLEELDAVPLLGDYTRFPAEITEELGRFGRAGVPLVLVYPKNREEPPIVLPEPSPLLPPSYYRDVVLKALEQADR